MSKSLKNIFSLEGKTFVIIGGAGKMGLSFSETLIENNSNVIVADLDNTIDRLNLKSKDNLHYINCDVCDIDSIKSLFNNCKKLYGKIDGLVYNVMAKPKNYYKEFINYDFDTWNQVINANLSGAFFSVQEASRILNHNPGRTFRFQAFVE